MMATLSPLLEVLCIFSFWRLALPNPAKSREMQVGSAHFWVLTFGFSEFRKPDRSMAMEERLYRQSRLCRLLRNPVAYSIVAVLVEKGEMTPTQIAKVVGRSLGRVSSRLATLRLAEVVRYETSGGHTKYRLKHASETRRLLKARALTSGLSEFRKSRVTKVVYDRLGADPGRTRRRAVLTRFRQGGLAQQADSWVSTGQNMNISGDQLQQVFGSSTISDLASQLGMSEDQAGSAMAQLLPEVINRVTPEGQVPQNGNEEIAGGCRCWPIVSC